MTGNAHPDQTIPLRSVCVRLGESRSGPGLPAGSSWWAWLRPWPSSWPIGVRTNSHPSVSRFKDNSTSRSARRTRLTTPTLRPPVGTTTHRWPPAFTNSQQPTELVVHNLEHGHVVIFYDCSKLTDCQRSKEQLQQLAERYRNWKVTIVPRQNADAAIAVAAWGRLDKLENFDEERITAFISAWRDRGPERTED